MTTYSCKPPCAYAKALMWVVGVLCVMMCSAAVLSRNNDRALIGLQKDMQYLRSAVDELRIRQRQVGHFSETKSEPES
jgi:hypothetical protein